MSDSWRMQVWSPRRLVSSALSFASLSGWSSNSTMARSAVAALVSDPAMMRS